MEATLAVADWTGSAKSIADLNVPVVADVASSASEPLPIPDP